MKNYFFALTSLITVSAYSQKPIYYFDENDIEISEKIYLEKYRNREDSIYYHSISLENDTCFVQKLVNKEPKGRLSKKAFDVLISSLNKSNPKPKAKYTVIQYYPGKDRCNGGKFYGNRFDKGYLRKLKKEFSFNNYWVYKFDESMDFSSNSRVNWQLDENRTVERLFFKYHYPCSSFIILDNESKNYIGWLGEYGDSSVTEALNKFAQK